MRNLLVILLLPVIIFSQYYFDLEKISRPRFATMPIPAKVVKLSDLGLHSAASAFMWLDAIQQFEGSSKEQLPGIIKNINEIDPKFSYPYAFATLILPALGMSEQTLEIGKAGIMHADRDWRIPYYLATIYHINYDDRKSAALYFSLAAETPGAPENVKSIAARYGTAGDQLEQTKQIWISLYENSEDEFVLKRATSYIIHIEMMQALQKASRQYYQKYGYWPKDLESLVTAKIIKGIPESPLGVKFTLKSQGNITVR
jgi:hypothetical protein